MKITIYKIKNLIDRALFRIAQKISNSEHRTDDIFFDLAPINNADPDGLYARALDFSMSSPAVRNIALTGPYGSGKTSVIKTYEKERTFRFLNISLATFSDPKSSEQPEKINADEITTKIERSILQQMLYGADSKKLPYSRFKRISKPHWLNTNAISFTFWIGTCAYLYYKKEEILKTSSLENLEPLWIFASLYVAAYFSQLVSRALRASHSLSVKKLSLQNGAIELDHNPESSILNKHLDEIIYFFEENHYDAVVFEDLDRFGDPEIFIKLREINKIINNRDSSAKNLKSIRNSQPLKFLYAIKDDVFLNKDRAKFFDFITPVIPIINNSNSREMLTKCIAQRDINNLISPRFLSEVSLYLDDFRLIKNISNEFYIYQGKIGGHPNLEKLLAIIIYKNTYPKDFEELHHGRGALHSIAEQRTRLIFRAAAQIDENIEPLKEMISSSETELCTDTEELIKIFWGQLCGNYQDQLIKGIYSGDKALTYSELLQWDNFKKLFIEKSIRILAQRPGTYYEQDLSLGCSFRELEEAASPGLKFEVRYERIKNKNLQIRGQLNFKIDTLKEAKAELSRKPLHELIKEMDVDVNSIALAHSIEDPKLLSYLIKNGYLDETYHLYISIFHEGRMSRNDWSFIQAIRDFRSPDPSTPIDTPKEVISEMREEDFGAGYALNVNLIDYLLETSLTNNKRLQSALELISKKFDTSDDFFQAYWISGRNVESFTQVLAKTWPEYALLSINSEQSSKHIARIISYVSPQHVAELMNTGLALTNYLSRNSHAVFSENIPFLNGYNSLKQIAVQVDNIKTIENLDELLLYIYENSLYSINVANVNFNLTKFSKMSDDAINPQENCLISNYTTIANYSEPPLIDYINANINEYIENVALVIETNTRENKESIIKLINHPAIDSELAIQYATKQAYVFESFEEIPQNMWNDMFLHHRVAINWENIATYVSHEDHDKDELSKKLDNEALASELSKYKIQISENNESTIKTLCKFLLSNTNIALKNYEKLCRSIPYHYRNFPEIPTERKIILTKLNIVRLNDDSFLSTEDLPELRAELININFETYIGNTENYRLGIEEKTQLFSITTHERKAVLIREFTLDEIESNTRTLLEISSFLANPITLTEEANITIVDHCLSNTLEPSIVIEILINFIDSLTPPQIIAALKKSPEPYCNFVKANARQKVIRTERNLKLAKALEREKIVSSVSVGEDSIRVNAFRKNLIDPT